MSKKQSIKKDQVNSDTGPGRPPLDVDALRLKIIYEAPPGLGDEKLIEFLQIGRGSYYKLKAENADFLDTVKFYQNLSSLEVLKSFTKVACGFSFDEETKELKKNKENGKMELVTTKVVTKHVTPNAEAAYKYLKNRMPDHFKDKIEAVHNFPSMLENITFVIKSKDNEQT